MGSSLWRQIFRFLVTGSQVTLQHGSKDQWDVLNATVHGRLHASSPFARSCFPEASRGVLGHYDAEACSAIVAGNADPGETVYTIWQTTLELTPTGAAFRVNQPGSYMNVGI